ncbi:MAG: carboxypeptidase-like regulatory domain-containing protein, partial [Candidatus Kapabacteria bacterium]|nr:carboxypeptidase-like regulatory domain-containing protein [Candidatus Kapabacteria bacterium]MDW7996108.1 carboxypeptidase-like regulatory domain-containing protein [Bacteroidota bacterium]
MRRYLVYVAALVVAPVSLWAGIYGVLAGRVTDKEGKPIPGATIRIEGTTLGGFARSDGRFSIVNVPAGTYTVIVRAVGYREVRLQVRISADQTTEIAVQLETEAVRVQEVTVEAKAPLVEKYAIGTLRNVSSEEIRNIPRQTVQQVALLTPGVLAAGNGFIVRGSRAIETQIRLDGLDIADQFVGAFGNGGFRYFPTVTNLAVEEIQVLTGNFAAEYGNALGGVVNTVTKTGRTDRYEATLRFYTDNIGFLYGSAQNGLRRLPSKEYNYELALGGPIPLLGGSTFYVSAQYLTNSHRNAGLDVKDPWGNSWGQLPQDRTWMRSLSSRMKFAVTKDISLLVGGMFGLTNYERPSIGWMYAQGEGLVNGESNGIQEYFAKRAVIDQFVGNVLARITHTLSQTTYYELTVSNTWNVNEVSRRYVAYEPGRGWVKSYFDRPHFFKGFDLWYPQDEYVVEGNQLLAKGLRGGVGDKVIDHYTLLTGQTVSED